MKKLEVEEIWSLRKLKLKKFEAKEIWSWWNLKLKKFEVEEIWSWRKLKLKKIEVEENWSWRKLKLMKFEVEEIWNLRLKKLEVEEIWNNRTHWSSSLSPHIHNLKCLQNITLFISRIISTFPASAEAQIVYFFCGPIKSNIFTISYMDLS